MFAFSITLAAALIVTFSTDDNNQKQLNDRMQQVRVDLARDLPSGTTVIAAKTYLESHQIECGYEPKLHTLYGIIRHVQSGFLRDTGISIQIAIDNEEKVAHIDVQAQVTGY